MSLFTLILKSFKHYIKGHLTVALGIAITTAIITGALIVGDSVTYSLLQTTRYRLGNISHVVHTGERYITQAFSDTLSQQPNIQSTPVLKLYGSGIVGGGEHRLEKIQVWGIDRDFKKVVGTGFPYDSLDNNEIIISKNVAERLMLKPGDRVLLRMTKASAIPLNTPFVSENNQTVSRRFKVYKIAGKKDYGRLNLKTSQTAPFNVFIPIDQLNSLMEMENKANLILAQYDKQEEFAGLKEAVKENFTYRDANFHVQLLDHTGEWEITSERVFIDDTLTNRMLKEFNQAQPILTYFVNEIRNHRYATPYSFVSTVHKGLKNGEILLNEWLARDIHGQIGDSITLSYYVIGPPRQLTEKQSRFKVKDIVPMEGYYGDKTLMPDFPGLSDVSNCRDWDTGIPIKLDQIRDKDETYWDEYRGTPKAFISLNKAVQLWKNRYGSYTAVRLSGENMDEPTLRKKLNELVHPFNLGIQIQDVKEQGLKAAKSGVDFSQLFLGLSFFILVSGILLTALLFVFNLEQRYSQIATLSALGYSRKSIIKIILSENALVAVMGALLGVLLSLGYNKLVFYGLNQVWQEIVRTNVLEINIQGFTLLNGLLISITVSLLTLIVVLHRKLKKETVKLQKNTDSKRSQWSYRLNRILLIILPLISISIVIIQVLKGEFNNPASFFVAGGLLLIFFIILTLYLFKVYDRIPSGSFSLKALSIKNLIRNRTRSITVILLLSLGTFIVIATGANRKNLFANAGDKSSGTGGFMFYAESTVPVLKNLQRDSIKQNFGLDTGLNIVQFKVHEGDDASCLNLNRVSNPRILGVNPRDLEGRFRFVTKTRELDDEHPWKSLNQDFNGVIPAIADQTVIKWGLGKEVGDTLVYTNHNGKEIQVKLIGGIAPSIFQGNIIISNEHFIQQFPQISGSNVFLLDGKPGNKQSVREELNLVFRDYGWRLTPAVQRLAEFMSVTNTYLSIFLVLGAFGLLLGTVGLAIVLARSIYQRSNELALLMAAGYSLKKVFMLLFRENMLLMGIGILGGGLSALIAVLPSFAAGQQTFSVGFILLLIGLICINGMLWIGFISYTRLHKLKIAASLKNE